MYLALMLCNFKKQFNYRASLYMKILGSVIRVYIQVCIWQALLQVGTSVEQTVEQLVTYTVIGFLIDQITYNNVAQILAQKVKEGSIAIDLIRPISLKWYLFYQQVSENLFNLFFVGVPVIIAAIILWNIYLPSLVNVFCGIFSLVLAVFLTFLFQYSVGLLVFWLKDVTYTRFITVGVVELFSGSLIPLWFYPEGFRKICNMLPFRFMVFEPIAIFLGEYDIKNSISIIAAQFVWIAMFNLLGMVVWRKVQMNIVVQGG